MEDILVPLSFFGAIAAIVIFLTFTVYRIRIEAIRKGPLNFLETPEKTGSNSLLFGLLSVAIGLECFISAFFYQWERHILFTVCLFWLFIGGALITYWKMTAKDREQNCSWYERIISSKAHDDGQP